MYLQNVACTVIVLLKKYMVWHILNPNQLVPLLLAPLFNQLAPLVKCGRLTIKFPILGCRKGADGNVIGTPFRIFTA